MPNSAYGGRLCKRVGHPKAKALTSCRLRVERSGPPEREQSTTNGPGVLRLLCPPTSAKFIRADTPGHEQSTRNNGPRGPRPPADLAVLFLIGRGAKASADADAGGTAYLAHLIGIRQHVLACEQDGPDRLMDPRELTNAIVADYPAFAERNRDYEFTANPAVGPCGRTTSQVVARTRRA